MAWREDLHPRDTRGRFAPRGSSPAVQIKATLTNLHEASDDDLMDVFHRLSSTKRLDQRSLARIDAELARRDEVAKLPPPDDTPEQIHIDQLVSRGYSYAEAYTEAYGVSGGREDQGAGLVERRAGETPEQARRRAYAEVVALESLQAEEATRGNLLSKKCPDADATALWSAPPARARKCASEELLRWWEANGGRRTYTDFRAQLVGGGQARRAAKDKALAGSGRDFGV